MTKIKVSAIVCSVTVIAGLIVAIATGASPTGELNNSSVTKYKPCTEAGESANFAVFSLGESFDGLPLTDILRRCQDPNTLPADLRGRFRPNYVAVIYGDCTPEGKESSCTPPLEIQSYPACERNQSLYYQSFQSSQRASLSGTSDIPRFRPPSEVTIRGVPAALSERGQSLEIYTGDSTIVIMGDSAELVWRAGLAISETTANPWRDPGVKSSVTGLRQPATGAMEGRLSCI